jgi:hypothetical protein
MPMLLAVLLTDKDVDQVVRLSRVQSVLIWLGLTVATTAAMYANARRYVTGVDGPTMIDSLEWWWESAPSPGAVTVIGGLAFAVFAAPLVVMHWQQAPLDRGSHDKPDPQPEPVLTATGAPA